MLSMLTPKSMIDDCVYLIEEKEFINNFNNLADLFAQ